MQIYYGVNSQRKKDHSAGKPVEFLEPGLKNSAVKCTTEVFTADRLVEKDSLIAIAAMTPGYVPAFCILETTENLDGAIGTKEIADLFGTFRAKRYLPVIVMPNEPNTPVKTHGDIFILTGNNFDGQIKLKLFFT